MARGLERSQYIVLRGLQRGGDDLYGLWLPGEEYVVEMCCCCWNTFWSTIRERAMDLFRLVFGLCDLRVSTTGMRTTHLAMMPLTLYRFSI